MMLFCVQERICRPCASDAVATDNSDYQLVTKAESAESAGQIVHILLHHKQWRRWLMYKLVGLGRTPSSHCKCCRWEYYTVIIIDSGLI